MNDPDEWIRDSLRSIAEIGDPAGVLDRVRVRVARRRRHRRLAIGGTSAAVIALGLVAGVILLSAGGSDRQVTARPGQVIPRSGVKVTAAGEDVIGLAAADDSGVWGAVETRAARASLVHVDPSGQKLLSRTPLPAPPVGVVAGNGAIWVTTLAQNGGSPYGKLLRIDPTNGTVLNELPLDVAGSIALTGDAIWVAAPALNELYRVNRQGTQVVTVITGIDASFVLSAFNRVWVVGTQSHSLAEIDPDTSEIVRRVPLGTIPGPGVSTGKSLWIIDQETPALIGVEPTTGSVSAREAIPDRIVSIASDANDVWAGSETSQPYAFTGSLYRTSPTGPATAEPIKVPGDSTVPAALAVHAGTLWIVMHDGILVGISTSS